MTITAELIDQFVGVSGDRGRIHVDSAFARARGFRGRLAHGMLLGAVISSVIGTEIPGDAGVLQDVKLLFHNPCYEGDEITVTVTVVEVHESTRTVTCGVDVRNAAGSLLVKGWCRSGLVDAS